MAKGDITDPYTVGTGGDYANWAALLAAHATVTQKHIKLLENVASTSALNTNNIGGAEGSPTTINLNGFGFVFTGGSAYLSISDTDLTFTGGSFASDATSTILCYANAVRLIIDGNSLSNSNANGACIRLDASNTQAHTSVTITDNIFSVTGASGKAVRWLAGNGEVSTLVGLTIDGNTVNGGSYPVEIRAQSNSHADAYLANITITNNVIRNATGFAVYVADGKATPNANTKAVKVNNNTISDVGSGNTGCGIAVYGFAPTTAATFGSNEISNNVITNIIGDGGGIDVFTTSYLDIYGNTVDGTSTGNIDANSILVDNGCDYVRVRRNICNNALGSTAANSGCGVMVLDADHVEVYGNQGDGMRVGIWYGAGTHVGCVNYNNTFTGITVAGIWATVTVADPAAVILKNNRFVGTGYSINNLASGTADMTTDYNSFSGFASGLNGQSALGANDKTDGTYLGLGTWLAGVRAYDDLPLPLKPDIGAVQDRTAPGRRFGAGGGKR